MFKHICLTLLTLFGKQISLQLLEVLHERYILNIIYGLWLAYDTSTLTSILKSINPTSHLMYIICTMLQKSNSNLCNKILATLVRKALVIQNMVMKIILFERNCFLTTETYLNSTFIYKLIDIFNQNWQEKMHEPENDNDV